MSEQAALSRNPEWIGAWVGSELMLMHGESGTYVSASSTGGRIWELLEHPRTLAGVVDALEQEFDAPAELVRREAGVFVGRMLEEGIFRDGPR